MENTILYFRREQQNPSVTTHCFYFTPSDIIRYDQHNGMPAAQEYRPPTDQLLCEAKLLVDGVTPQIDGVRFSEIKNFPSKSDIGQLLIRASMFPDRFIEKHGRKPTIEAVIEIIKSMTKQ